MGKSTISMVIFNSYVKLPEGNMEPHRHIGIYTDSPVFVTKKGGPSPGTLVPFIHTCYGDLSPEKLQCGTPNHDPFPGYDSLYPEMVIWCHLVNGVLLIFPASPYDFLVFATKKTEKWSHKTTHQPSHWNGFAAKSFHQAIAPTAMAMQHLGVWNPWIFEAITMKIGGNHKK